MDKKDVKSILFGVLILVLIVVYFKHCCNKDAEITYQKKKSY